MHPCFPICLQPLGIVCFSPLEYAKIGHLMKLINLCFAYQVECLKALCLAITCISLYSIYHSLLGACAHNSALDMYQPRKHQVLMAPALCPHIPRLTSAARCLWSVSPLPSQATFYGLFGLFTLFLTGEPNFDLKLMFPLLVAVCFYKT